MRKVLLGIAFALSATSANAAGLYISAGYGQANPDFTATSKSSATSDCLNEDGTWNYECAYSAFDDLAGFPNSSKLANYNSSTKVGYQAADWDAGLTEKYDYNTKGSNTMAFAIGWDISQNPFRFELEYQKTKFKSPDYKFSVVDPDGNYYKGMYEDDATGDYESSTITFDDGSTIQNCNNGVCLNAQELSGNEGATSASSYDFDVSFYGDMKTNVDSLMANVYFEIPGFGSIDPYVGFGYGKSKVKFDYLVPNYDEDGETIVSYDTLSGGSDGYVNAQQFIAGVEYRFDETPLIAGIEYRQFKTDFNEKEDKDPYKFEHKYVMFKLRYDFISDEY